MIEPGDHESSPRPALAARTSSATMSKAGLKQTIIALSLKNSRGPSDRRGTPTVPPDGGSPARWPSQAIKAAGLRIILAELPPKPVLVWGAAGTTHQRMTDKFMQALFIGQTYIDVTFITDHMPTGDEKHVASAYAVSFGGNAVTAAFCCAKLGVVPDLIATVANDWLGRMFQDMSAKYGISIHPRKVNSSSLSFIMPKDGKRAIVRCRDDEHIHPFPLLNLKGCRALHIDGHQPDAAIHYARLCREDGILTSLDGGGLRTNTHELLEFIDVAIVAERLCEQMDLTPEKMLDYLKSRGCRVGGVTQGERGLLWYDETGATRTLPALPIARERVLDTNGAGDVFHGAYVYSYLSNPGKSWHDHFEFARAASTYKIQRLGNEAGLPTLADIEAVKREFQIGRKKEFWD
jgi:sugar/nucleoside kinase (ribokinase family)